MGPNVHLRKQWKRRVKTWFNQPAKKQARRNKRQEKAAQVAPRPLAGSLRPVVQCCTFRYNTKQRCGRGFTLAEIKGAGLTATQAKQCGVAIDKRRRNKSAENMQRNVQRLKEYKQKLARKIMPIAAASSAIETAKITADMKKGSVYHAFHMAKANVKFAGQREKRRKQREAE